jgi:multicomponent Na+:H+ antiporter subunit B
LVALLYSSLGAVDVGFNEAVLGAGVTGVFFLVAIYRTQRRSAD